MFDEYINKLTMWNTIQRRGIFISCSQTNNDNDSVFEHALVCMEFIRQLPVVYLLNIDYWPFNVLNDVHN